MLRKHVRPVRRDGVVVSNSKFEIRVLTLKRVLGEIGEIEAFHLTFVPEIRFRRKIK